ncbi:hypothetical protein GBAR_LOCUS18053, partial [Geodia barretti]
MTVRPSQLITMSGSFVDNVQLLDETIQHNLLLGMRPKSTPHHQKFDPGKPNGSIRVKFELGDEKRVVLLSRPLTLESMSDQLQSWFPGHRFTMYHYLSDVSLYSSLSELY